MPDSFSTYNPWSDAAGGLGGVGREINQLGVMLARQKFQQDLLRQQMTVRMRQLAAEEALNAAHVDMYKEQTRNLKAKTAIDVAKEAAARRFGESRVGSMTGFNPLVAGGGQTNEAAYGQNVQDAIFDTIRQAAILSALEGHPERTEEFQTQFSANRAVDPMTEQLARAILTKSRLFANVPAGGRGLDVTTGKVLAEGQPRLAGSGGSPESIMIRAAEAAMNPFFGDLPLPTQGNILNMTTNLPGTNQPMTMSMPAVTGTNAPAADELIVVTNPQGVKVRIRASQLQDALSQGYTR